MDAKKTDALVEVIRAILGPSDRNLSKDRIVALLAAADNDPNKAVDLYFQAEAANGAALKQNDVEGDNDDDADENDVEGDDAWSPQAAELSDLLGGDVKKQIILDLLRRTGGNLQKAVEIYFVEHGADNDFDESSDEEDDADGAAAAAAFPAHNALFPAASPRGAGAATEPAASSAELPPAPSAVTPIAAQPLEPLHHVAPSSAAAPSDLESAAVSADATSDVPMASAADSDAVKGPGTYEVVIAESDLKWQIGNVFGRAVVQAVDPNGPAALAGIHKSDVLLSFGDAILSEKNCTAIVQQLSTDVSVSCAVVCATALASVYD